MQVSEQFITIPGFEGSAVADSARALIAAAETLGGSQAAATLRSWCVPHIFGQREAIFDSNEEPVARFEQLLDRTARLLELTKDTGFASIGAAARAQGCGTTVESTTGTHYGKLFREFSPDAYWNETALLLQMRLERNGVDVGTIRGKSVLDAGCGGGRYTGAWRRLGAGAAVGLDISSINIADAQARAESAGLDEITFEEGDVLDLPFPANSFDIVFSNGVLHHTRNWKLGVAEIVRVLKPGGIGWLYLIENPGGLFWDSIEILREVMRPVDRETARTALASLGIPGNRTFYMLDHVMVPINIRLTPVEVESCLRESGASDIRRLTRGADFDRIERIHQNEPYAVDKFGVGENRYLFTKV